MPKEQTLHTDLQYNARGKELIFMKRMLLSLAAFALLIPGLAFAGNISFTTSDSFSNPSLFPITFTGTSVSNFVGGDFSFGVFQVKACPHASCTGTETFTLTVTQSAPGSGTAHLTGTISGSVLANGLTRLTLLFTSGVMVIDGITYLVPLEESLNFSFTTLNGTVGPTGVPEPTALVFLGIGVLGLAGLVGLRKMLPFAAKL